MLLRVYRASVNTHNPDTRQGTECLSSCEQCEPVLFVCERNEKPFLCDTQLALGYGQKRFLFLMLVCGVMVAVRMRQ